MADSMTAVEGRDSITTSYVLPAEKNELQLPPTCRFFFLPPLVSSVGKLSSSPLAGAADWQQIHFAYDQRKTSTFYDCSRLSTYSLSSPSSLNGSVIVTAPNNIRLLFASTPSQLSMAKLIRSE